MTSMGSRQVIPQTNGKYKADLNNFSILTWEVGPLSREVDFLDLTLTIEDG